MTANEALRDLYLRHDIGLHGLQTAAVRKILGLLSASERDIERQIRTRLGWIADRGYNASDFTLRRLEENLLEVRRTMREAYRALGRELRSDLVTLAGREGEWVAQSLSTPVPIELRAVITSIRLDATQLRAIVDSRPFQGALLKDWARQLEQTAYAKVRGAIRQGLLQSETIDQIVRRLRGTKAAKFADGILALSRREAETIVRTAVAHVAQTVRDDTLQANADVLRGVQWVGTLDSRTCPVCSIRDGLTYTLDHKPQGHGIPWGAGPGRMHHQDRCTSAPVLKSWRELGFDRGELPEGTRASMSGQVPASTTFADWIAKQSAEVQDEVLGKTRARQLRAGESDFGDFFGPKGQWKTLGAKAA